MHENGNRMSLVLAFWGRNMAPIRARGWTWPGFDYDEIEWQRLLTLAKTVSFDAFVGFQIVTAVLVIAAMGIVVAAGASVITPVYRMIPSDWAWLGPLGLLIAIPIAVFGVFGFGIPLAIRLAAAVTATESMRGKLTVSAGDAELATKIARQFRRMAAFIAGVLVLIASSELYLPEAVQHTAALVITIGSAIVAMLWL